MERRSFVRRLPVATAGLAAGLGGLSLGACGPGGYVVATPHPQGVAVDRALLAERGALLIQSPRMPRPVFVRHTDEGPIALLASCTHQGCQPDPVGDRLICPCHGSEFSMSGDVLEGPADRPLTRYDVTSDGSVWVVHVGGGES